MGIPEEKVSASRGSGKPLPWPFGPVCSGIEIQDSKQTKQTQTRILPYPNEKKVPCPNEKKVPCPKEKRLACPKEKKLRYAERKENAMPKREENSMPKREEPVRNWQV